MSDQQDHLKTISDIRSIMERSSRFISLSGLSGISAGVVALAGAYTARELLAMNQFIFKLPGNMVLNIVEVLFCLACLVLGIALLLGFLFTVRHSRKKGQLIWDAAARRLFVNLAIPLASGGLFCIVLLYHGIYGLVAPATLLFYGLALLNAGKYTLEDIRYLGICEIVLGLLSAWFIGYGLLFWAIGFGVLHIIYGAVMYYKYERG